MILFMITCSTSMAPFSVRGGHLPAPPLRNQYDLLAATSAHHAAGAAAARSAAAGATAMGHGVVERLLIGGQESVEGGVRLGIDGRQLPVQCAGRSRQLVDRRRVVRLDSRRERIAVGL